ncbi:response regulator [Polaribacter vadi]|uniref:hybrid sensor histidine kinase/response regulator transcription factor n=1 Tax=Polaribacter TaxID=52959 RepID=UPI001C08E70E|nr:MULTISPECIES: two-component regulator propeller domain-containing protein [Polaribacter]MBU3011384.1 response regulator [Polaribacter vadi]MDO6741196.1 two-component regulator propeller domain-containing protein [Polaribacter sp. 1_MG-2023]
MIKYIKSLYILYFLLLNVFITFGQTFERISNKEGFNQNTISDIEQDEYGFLWYGTPNGLIKYDGYQFKTYTTQSKSNQALSSNFIATLYNDKNGILWIGTNQGVDLYISSLEKFIKIPLTEKFLITKITQDSTGNIWFSGKNQLYKCKVIDIEKNVIEVSKNLLPPNFKNNILDFTFKNKETLILATEEGLTKVVLDTVNQKINSTLGFNSFLNTPINTICKVNDFFLVGTEKGVFKIAIDDNDLHIIKDFNQLTTKPYLNKAANVTDILNDNLGVIWIGTKNNGLYKYNEEKDVLQHFKYSSKNKLGISSNQINALYKDDFDVLWIGTAQGGINKLDIHQKKFINYSDNPYDPNSLSGNLITAILEDKRGVLWLSAYNTPLFRSTVSVNEKTVNNLNFKNLGVENLLQEKDFVRCLFEDKNGFIWVGSDFSVLVYNPKTNKVKKVNFIHNNAPYSEISIRAISETDTNEIIFSGNKILAVKNPWKELSKSKINLNVESIYDLGLNRTKTILKQDNNIFWFGTNYGLLKTSYTDDKFTVINYLTKNSDEYKLSYDNIFSLYKNDSTLWVGTFGGGLNKISFNKKNEPNNIKYFRKNNVLPDDAIYGILKSKDSVLWLSTDMGLVKFNMLNEEVNVYDVRDGISQNNFRQGAYFKGKSGYFYFGGLNGLTIFKPEEILENKQPPEILISGLSVNNNPIKIGEKFEDKVVFEKSISETDEFSISEKAQIISFNVVAKHTSTPSKNKLAYKLEGFNDTWNETEEGKEVITYTNLSAGSYKFEIKASNGDGIWGKSKTLQLHVLPPWYKNIWSFVLFFIIIISTITYVMFYFLKHQKLKERLKYEELDKQRIEIVNQGKFRYFTNLSHEFRTPLTLIAGPLERVMEQNSDSSNNKYLAIIQKNTKRLLSLVDQLITFRQAEQGYIDLKLVKYTLGDFIYPTTEAFENYALEKNINFFYKVNQPNEEIIIDVEKVERIIFNLLSNAFKNTPSQGTISIEAGIHFKGNEKIIEINVVDSGKGIPEEKLNNIFERFYQLGNSESDVSGGGIGLAFCKSLVNILEGDISATSKPGVETRFTVKIPSKELKDFDIKTSQESKKSFIKNWVPLTSDVINEEDQLSNTNKKKEHSILVVENELDVQHFLLSTLGNQYEVTIASNGLEGLEKIKLKNPDLVISDVMMPEMDGFELCNKIKSDSKTCHIPVLLLTALGANEDIVKGLEFGADEYLSKPFSIKHLELRVSKLIENSIRLKEYFAKNSDLPKEKNVIEISAKDEEFLEKIIEIIEKNLSNSSFGVEELSKEIGLSTSHFYRRLKQLTGQVPNVYIRNFRLQRAAKLLSSNKGYNVAQVMYQIGIESSSYFSSSFKKLHGVSPSEYLKKHRNP